jgi:hypothetical protein
VVPAISPQGHLSQGLERIRGGFLMAGPKSEVGQDQERGRTCIMKRARDTRRSRRKKISKGS